MASSKRHWPSMFKSKPCNPHHQWQHEFSTSLLPGYHRNPYTSGVEERSPEPKPRWNPKPEQIRILEAVFNSGMVNPPRDEIRKIRAQLQEFGQVGDANVFYWFQNRKSRSKHKNRQVPKSQQNQSNQLATARNTTHQSIPTTTPTTIAASSSSSSDKSSPKPNPTKTSTSAAGFSLGSCSSNLLDQLAYSHTTSVSQNYDHLVQQHDQPFMFPLQHLSFTTQGFPGFPDHQQIMMANSNSNLINNDVHNSVGPCTEFLFSELISNQHGVRSDPKKDGGDEEKLMMMQLGYATAPSATSTVVDSVPVSDSDVMLLPSTLNQLQGGGASGGSAAAWPMKSTVFINDVAFEVNCGPFHVRKAFGDDAVLLHSTGQPVLTNEWGVTHQPLQHGAFYYFDLIDERGLILVTRMIFVPGQFNYLPFQLFTLVLTTA